MSNWHDRNDRPLDIGDKVVYPRGKTTHDDTYENSRVIGYAGNRKVVVRGSFIDGPRIIEAKQCEKW